MNNVQVCLEETLHCPLVWVDSDRDAAEDTRDDESVARLRYVYEFIVYAEGHSMGCLAIRYGVRGFLQANNLSISKLTTIVDKRHRPQGSTDVSRTPSGFFNLASVDFYLDGV